MKQLPQEQYAELWYIESPYTLSGQPKMEAALVDYAVDHFVHRLVTTDELYDCKVKLLQEQDRIKAQNGRLSTVNVDYRIDRGDPIAWFYVGRSHFVLHQIRKGSIHD